MNDKDKELLEKTKKAYYELKDHVSTYYNKGRPLDFPSKEWIMSHRTVLQKRLTKLVDRLWKRGYTLFDELTEWH